MTTMNNLEKLIQMATIEHMYSMLQKMEKNNILVLSSDPSLSISVVNGINFCIFPF